MTRLVTNNASWEVIISMAALTCEAKGFILSADGRDVLVQREAAGLVFFVLLQRRSAKTRRARSF